MRRSSMLSGMAGAVVLAGILNACGSGGAPSVSASGSGSGSASASGTVTGFGSVFVNGKRFETENVEVRSDGTTERCTITSSPARRCGLKEGMIVNVSGTFSGSSRRATSIIQEDTLEGPITSVDVRNSRFVALGQTVLVDDATRFDSGVSLNNLVAGDIVEVSGFVKSDGIVVASFIERKAPAPGCAAGCEIKGVVKNHDHATSRFEIGGLTVVYDIATIISDMPVPNGSNWNGIFVEVKGTNFDAGIPTLTATKVEPENGGVGNVIDEFEVEGFVTQAGTANGNVMTFTIGTTPVQTTANTEFRGGTIDEIVVGAKLSAEGRFDGSTLLAKHVKFHDSVRLEGDIGMTGTNFFTIKGLPGITIHVNSQTEFKANGGATINNLSDLAINDHVRVRGRASGTDSVTATRIQLRSPDNNDVDLQGPVQTVSNPHLTILGVSMDTTGVQFEGVDGRPMSRAAFFATVQVGTLVKVKGIWNGTTVTWEEAELED